MADQEAKSVGLILRSAVEQKSDYRQYKHELRYDFYHSCAYCTLSECEGGGVRFTIDHYEPQSSRPDLINHYENLLWCCDTCNIYKGDRNPSAKAKLQGNRFFRPDLDEYFEHFTQDGVSLRHLSQVGYFTIQFIDLNRAALKRVREMRNRLYNCIEVSSAGIRALRSFGIDRLPTNLRGPAQRLIRDLIDQNTARNDAVSSVLREFAKSHLLDDDPEKQARAIVRGALQRELNVMYPLDNV